MTESPSLSLPVRKLRAVRNDGLILDSAVTVLARDGWGELALARVGRNAGLSHRAVQTRYEGRQDLGSAVWHQRVGAAFGDAVSDVLSAAGLLDAAADAQEFSDLLARFAAPDQELVGAAELLIVAQFEPVIAAAINETLTPQLHEWITPRGRAVTRTMAAQRAMVLIQALGLIGTHAHGGKLDFTQQAAALFDALRNPAAPQTLPKVPAWHVKQTTQFDTGDAVADAVLEAASILIAERGYDRTRTSDIAKRAGIPEATLFTRFPTKLDVLTTATELQHARALPANLEFGERTWQDYGPGVGEAVAMRALMRPAITQEQLLNLEQYRLAWHVQALQEAQAAAFDQTLGVVREQRLADHPDWTEQDVAASVHWDLSLGFGWGFLATVAPDSWKLPFDVVTVPLYG